MVLRNDVRSIPDHVIPKTSKMVLDTSLLNIRYVSRVKWSNPGKGVAPSPIRWCSSYWKGSFLIALDYGRQLYLLILLCNILCANFWIVVSSNTTFRSLNSPAFFKSPLLIWVWKWFNLGNNSSVSQIDLFKDHLYSTGILDAIYL